MVWTYYGITVYCILYDWYVRISIALHSNTSCRHTHPYGTSWVRQLLYCTVCVLYHMLYCTVYTSAPAFHSLDEMKYTNTLHMMLENTLHFCVTSLIYQVNNQIAYVSAALYNNGSITVAWAMISCMIN